MQLFNVPFLGNALFLGSLLHSVFADIGTITTFPFPQCHGLASTFHVKSTDVDINGATGTIVCLNNLDTFASFNFSAPAIDLIPGATDVDVKLIAYAGSGCTELTRVLEPMVEDGEEVKVGCDGGGEKWYRGAKRFKSFRYLIEFKG